MEKLKLHYAKIDLRGDIPVYQFNEIKELIDFIEESLFNEKTQYGKLVYLLCYKEEIFVSDIPHYIVTWLDAFHVLADAVFDGDTKNIFLQEYPSFEEAYGIALNMKEENKLCYSSATMNSPYWRHSID